MKQAALYARVSTQRQAEEATIVSQVAQVQAYAEKEGYGLKESHIFVDEGISGKSLSRPGLMQLRDTAMTGAFEAILCLSPDRLSRNLGVQTFLTSEWRRLNIDLVFVNRGRAVHTPQDKLLLDIEGAFAEYERTVISDRLQRGRRHRIRSGQSMPHPAPYGYHLVSPTGGRGSRWQIHEGQAQVVRQIYDWYTHDNLTMSAIVVRLTEQKTPPPRATCWYFATVEDILQQPAYKGLTYYGRTRRDYSAVGQPRKQGTGRLQSFRLQPRPVEEWIEVPTPVIISSEQWQYAQEKRLVNANMAARNSKRTYLLKGLLVCSICQRTLQGRTQGNHSYYRCPGGGKQRPVHVPSHSCTVRGDEIEPQVWQALAELLRNPQRIHDAWIAQQASETDPPTQIDQWKKRQLALRKERKRLLDAYQADALSLRELTKRQNPLIQELRELDARLSATAQIHAVELSLDQFTERIERALQSVDIITQQEVIRLLIERILVSDNEIVIEHIIPTKNDSQLEPLPQTVISNQ